jgi:nucleotide-binding universal stress UspA family protein
MKRILVGLDGSDRATGVLDASVTLGRALGARLVVFRAVGLPPDLPQDFFKTTDQAPLEFLCNGARDYLKACTARVPAELLAPEGPEVVVGVAWDAVCGTARRLQVDLIVIGSHGYGGIDRLLGTTAAKVVNHAPCSVLVVRDRPLEGRPG